MKRIILIGYMGAGVSMVWRRIRFAASSCTVSALIHVLPAGSCSNTCLRNSVLFTLAPFILRIEARTAFQPLFLSENVLTAASAAFPNCSSSGNFTLWPSVPGAGGIA